MMTQVRLFALSSVFAFAAGAQESAPVPAPAPAPKPAPSVPSQAQVLDDILKDQTPPPTPATETKTAKAEVPPSPPVNMAELLRAPGAVLGPLEPEGMLVIQARAQLVRIGGEKKIPAVTFHSDHPKDAPRRPMLLLANRKLEEIERLLAKAGPDTQIVVSGVVEVYRGNNYLRLTRAVLRDVPAAARKTEASGLSQGDENVE